MQNPANAVWLLSYPTTGGFVYCLETTAMNLCSEKKTFTDDIDAEKARAVSYPSERSFVVLLSLSNCLNISVCAV